MLDDGKSLGKCPTNAEPHLDAENAQIGPKTCRHKGPIRRHAELDWSGFSAMTRALAPGSPRVMPDAVLRTTLRENTPDQDNKTRMMTNSVLSTTLRRDLMNKSGKT